jgi:hypothetical protein
MLIVNIIVLPYFENRNKVYELHNIFEETGSKLRRYGRTFTILTQPLFLKKCSWLLVTDLKNLLQSALLVPEEL